MIVIDSSLAFKWFNSNEADADKAVAFSKKYQVSVYDSIYVVLAKENKCPLITADKRFAEKINLSFVRLLQDYK